MTHMYKCIQCVGICRSGLDVALSTFESLSKCDGVVKVLSVFQIAVLIRWKSEMDGTFAL